jgi:hypothetical protein
MCENIAFEEHPPTLEEGSKEAESEQIEYNIHIP